MPKEQPETLVSLESVYKSYGEVHALKDISVNIKAGEVLGLFGHNGAGKTTLMKLVLGIIGPSKGNVLTLGHAPRSIGSHHYRRQFGYLPENVSFYDHLSGREVLRYFAQLKGYNKAEAERLLKEVGLENSAGRAVKTYSKGMRQRLGLAQALLGSPKLLVLDEPTVGLDPIATHDFYITVDRLKSQGCAVILCSHILPGVEKHIDRAMIMGGGQKLAIGNLDELRRDSTLPIEIQTHGIAANEIHETLLQYHRSTNNTTDQSYQQSQTTQSLFVPIEEKMTVIRQLSSDHRLNDLEIKQPSLQEIYTYYTTKLASKPHQENLHG